MDDALQFEPFGYCRMPARWQPDALSVLRDVRALLDDPAQYTTDDFAIDADGQALFPDHEDAVKWGLWGAIYKICGCGAPDRKGLRPGSGWATLALANFLVNRTHLDHWAYRFGSAQAKLTYDEVILTLDLAVADLDGGLWSDPDIGLISRMYAVAGKARQRGDGDYDALLKGYAGELERTWKARQRERPRSDVNEAAPVAAQARLI